MICLQPRVSSRNSRNAMFHTINVNLCMRDNYCVVSRDEVHICIRCLKISRVTVKGACCTVQQTNSRFRYSTTTTKNGVDVVFGATKVALTFPSLQASLLCRSSKFGKAKR